VCVRYVRTGRGGTPRTELGLHEHPRRDTISGAVVSSASLPLLGRRLREGSLAGCGGAYVRRRTSERVHGQSAAPAPMASQAEPPATPPAGLACTPSKRERDSGGSSSSCEPRVSKVRFSHVTVRELGMEIWGGGGVPADDGPPLGLSWDLQSTRHVNIDDWEAEREQSRTPKDSYCFEGCVEPNVRRQMLLGAGSTHKQIKAATKAVAQLNQDRWKVRSPTCPHLVPSATARLATARPATCA
jgi:hypothetical protein